MKRKISGWGRYPIMKASTWAGRAYTEIAKKLAKYTSTISYGLGRSYGDAALNKILFLTSKLNCFLSIDLQRGIIECEAGVSLRDILDLIVPKGWFLSVVPGTKHITVGGAIASDIHGKNHHKTGTFSDHVLSMSIMLPNGEIISCSTEKDIDLFRATSGGMGLTGIILNAKLKLVPIETPYIKQTIIKAKNLNELMELFYENNNVTYSVAWIDSFTTDKKMGKGFLILGEHASNQDIEYYGVNRHIYQKKKKKNISIPFGLPAFFLNPHSVKLFNRLYYNKTSSTKVTSLASYDEFFFPLDIINNWNRIYGKRGFTQYQFVLPKDISKKGIHEILSIITKQKNGAFLTVLKLLGKGNGNLLSFPMEGYTLALDFPITRKTFALLDELDKIVLRYNGRIYLSKDVRMKRRTFEKTYPFLTEFKRVKKEIDPYKKFQSLQSIRLGI